MVLFNVACQNNRKILAAALLGDRLNLAAFGLVRAAQGALFTVGNMIIGDLTPAELETILRQDFTSFAARCFSDLNPQTELAMNWHLDVIAAKLMEVRRGRIRRLIINLPPPPEILDGVDCVPGVAPRTRPLG